MRSCVWESQAGGFEGLQARVATPCAPVLGLPAVSVKGVVPCSGRKGVVLWALQDHGGERARWPIALLLSRIVEGRFQAEESQEAVCGLGTNEVEGLPVASKDGVVEETDGAVADAQGAWSESVNMLAVSDVVLQFLFGDEIRR